jgi:predicted ATP-grasp superfamily ATP-dependent carboligase
VKSLQPILLCDATFSGTLAAVRSLGRSGVPVVVADSAAGAPAFWSRYATRTVRCPPIADVPRFLEWVMRFGEREGRHVFHPTSDELVYVIAAHHEELSTRFSLYQPDLPTTMRVLDKKLLYEAAREAGLGAPDTWFPGTSGEVEAIAREAGKALMVKPRTQAFLRKHPKGAVGPRDPAELRGAYEKFHREGTYDDPVASRMPELTRPMLQRYYPDAAESIFSVTGFRDVTGRHLALLGSVKVLQRPRRVGIGLCFESAPLPPGLFEKVAVFLERIGFYGIFELEFVRDDEELLLIDMNPRFYHQVALDVARGLALPQLAYSAALGDETEVARLVATAPSGEGSPHAFCNRIGLEMLVGAQRLSGKMSTEEAARWHDWTLDPTRTLVDSVAEKGDPGPLVAEIVRQLYGCVRHPRSFVRMIALDR